MEIGKEFIVFFKKQLRSCIFAGTFFFLMFFSRYITSFGLTRYDFLFITAISVQILLVAIRIESLDELKVICIFHIIGLCLELFKTHPLILSWQYPEQAFFKLGTVPLYSGFMYASVASYIIQAWRQFDLRLIRYPSYWLSIPLSVGIYLNFFTKHFIPDLRFIFILAIIIVFFRTRVCFVVKKNQRSMPLIVAFTLIAFFIWTAENISTFLGAWQYPDQANGWSLVHMNKISSWFLLFIISFIIVADLLLYKYKEKRI